MIEPNAAYLRALVDKLPTFDPSWSAEYQASWFEAFWKLAEMADAVKRREQEQEAECARRVREATSELVESLEALLPMAEVHMATKYGGHEHVPLECEEGRAYANACKLIRKHRPAESRQEVPRAVE